MNNNNNNSNNNNSNITNSTAQTIVNTATLSTTQTISTKQEKDSLLPHLYSLANWRKSTDTMPLIDIVQSTDLMVIRTDNIIVLDFDDDHYFAEAMKMNALMPTEDRCNYIVKSTRKGGHMYFAYTPDSPQYSPLHTKQQVVDILEGAGHNALAPTQAEKGKVLQTEDFDGTLRLYPTLFNLYINSVIDSNVEPGTRTVAYTLTADSRYSDDAIHMVKAYLAGTITDDEFNRSYNIPHPMPAGTSNDLYKKLSTRLGSDETISTEIYLKVMRKFNLFHQRKTPAELKSQHTDRMVKNLNGLWKYDHTKEDAQVTYAVPHKRFKTQAQVFFNQDSSYLVSFKDADGDMKTVTYKNRAGYIDAAEKLLQASRQAITNSTSKITTVDTIHKYGKKPGFDRSNYTFNTAHNNRYLQAFSGSQPIGYAEPARLLTALKEMWGENYDYLLDSTKFRYSSFKFSPVITYIMGAEGSGKDITIDLLTRGFASENQQLNYQLIKDKHSSWQCGDNAVFSEIGEWKQYEMHDTLAEMKTVSGSNGKVTFRGMQKEADVQDTIVKLWITSNGWIKLHTDITQQRRLHIVYMPKPLSTLQGGKYSTRDIEEIFFNEQTLLNFYYWLGNRRQYATKDIENSYMNATAMQGTEAYSLYIDEVSDRTDLVSKLLWSRRYEDFITALDKYSLTLSQVETKRGKDKFLTVSIPALVDLFTEAGATQTTISKTLNSIAAQYENNRRIMFDGQKVKCYRLLSEPDIAEVEAVIIPDTDGLD